MKYRSVFKFLIDTFFWLITIPAAYFLRLEGEWSSYFSDIGLLVLISIPVVVLVIILFDFNRQSWHNIGVQDLFILAKGILISFILIEAIAFIFRSKVFIPYSVPLLSSILAFLILGGIRLLTRFSFENITRRKLTKGTNKSLNRVLIVGAGNAGNMLLRELFSNSKVMMQPVGFLDDDPLKQKALFKGIPVLGRVDDLPRVVNQYGIHSVLIAIPSAPGKVIRHIVDLIKNCDVDFKIVPDLYELLNGKLIFPQLRNVDVHDLLRREHIEFNAEVVSKYINDKVIMVTGAGGSIGSEIVRQLSRCHPKLILLLGRGENSIFKIENECKELFVEQNFVSLITDIKDYDSLEAHFLNYRPDIIFHTAAHKHVSLMEKNPEQAIFNNVVGTKNLVDLALKYRVNRFVNISSDKSVNPSSIMGASKRVAEFVVEWGSFNAHAMQEFVSVRFGNVLGSRGSVIPIFKKQIERGGPVTITHPDMTRFFMTIPEASQLVLQAGGMGGNGSVYVLDMGEPVKILDLAHDLIRLSGLRPGEDIEIVYTGIKPGEKMYEELLTNEENTSVTKNLKIFIAKTSGFPRKRFEDILEELVKIAQKGDGEQIRHILKKFIPTYNYNLSKANSN